MREPQIYGAVNAAWEGREIPALTGPEAITAAKRLWRRHFGKPCHYKVKLTSGNRFTWVYRGELRVNPDKGWHGLVHDLSHLFHRRQTHGLVRPHDPKHAYLERDMRAYVAAQGWLDGRLKRPEKVKAPRNLVAERAARVEARIAAWEAKAKRASTALKKLRKQRAYYSKKLG